MNENDMEAQHDGISEYHDDHDTELAYVLRIDDVDGFPDTIVADLTRADADEADSVRVSYWWNDEERQSVVLAEAMDDAAMRWLYDWLEESCEHYQREYVDAEGEYRAARELADAVFEAMSS